MTKLEHIENESRMLDPASSGEDFLDVGKNEFMIIPEVTTVSQELVESQGYFGVYLAGVILVALFVSIPLGLFIFRKLMECGKSPLQVTQMTAWTSSPDDEQSVVYSSLFHYDDITGLSFNFEKFFAESGTSAYVNLGVSTVKLQK